MSYQDDWQNEILEDNDDRHPWRQPEVDVEVLTPKQWIEKSRQDLGRLKETANV